MGADRGITETGAALSRLAVGGDTVEASRPTPRAGSGAPRRCAAA
jgi:hypothetical protein